MILYPGIMIPRLQQLFPPAFDVEGQPSPLTSVDVRWPVNARPCHYAMPCIQSTYRYKHNDHTPEHSSQIRWAHSSSSHLSFYKFGLMVCSWSMGPMKGCGALKTAIKHYTHAGKNLETAQNGRIFTSAPLAGAMSGLSTLASWFDASKILSPSFRS